MGFNPIARPYAPLFPLWLVARFFFRVFFCFPRSIFPFCSFFSRFPPPPPNTATFSFPSSWVRFIQAFFVRDPWLCRPSTPFSPFFYPFALVLKYQHFSSPNFRRGCVILFLPLLCFCLLSLPFLSSFGFVLFFGKHVGSNDFQDFSSTSLPNPQLLFLFSSRAMFLPILWFVFDFTNYLGGTKPPSTNLTPTSFQRASRAMFPFFFPLTRITPSFFP